MTIFLNTLTKILFILFVVSIVSCKDKNTILNISVTNPDDYDRANTSVLLNLKEYFRGDQVISDRLYLYDGKSIVPSQFIDYDKDGQMDELFFIIDLKKHVTKNLSLKYLEGDVQIEPINARVNVRFGERKPPYKEIESFERVKKDAPIKASELFVMEGPAWENDKVGFRNYYDQRNGIDIFGKRTSEMVFDRVGIDGTNYHVLADWGMDILHVGNSLGAGAIAIRTRDTIFRVGESAKSSYRQIADGPLKGVLVLEHKNLDGAGNNYNITHQLSISAGQQYYESEVSATGVRPGDQLVVGIVNLHSDTLYVNRDIEGYVILATHDIQADDKAHLGMGLLIEEQYFEEVLSKNTPTNGIGDTYFIALKLRNNSPVKYRFYAGWETQDKKFASRNNFINMIKQDAMELSSALVVRHDN